MTSLCTAGSPLQFFVDAVNSGHVTAYGPGLSHGVASSPATFTIATKDAGEGKAVGDLRETSVTRL